MNAPSRLHRILMRAKCVLADARARVRDRRLRKKAAAIDRELDQLSAHVLHEAHAT
jgi:hypothetical protein